MNRATEVEILASTLEEPMRALLRVAIVAQRQGRLNASALVAADQARKRPSLRWAAFLLALDAAELALGGSVAIGTPCVRFAAGDGDGDLLFVERWGAFACTIYPEEIGVHLELVPERTHNDVDGVLILVARPARPLEAWETQLAGQRVGAIARWIGAHLDAHVRLDLAAAA